MKNFRLLIGLLVLSFAALAFGFSADDDAVINGKWRFDQPVTVNVRAPSDSKTAVQITGGALRLGAGTPGTTPGQNDAYITGTLEVDGVAKLDASTIGLRGVTYTLPSSDGAAGRYLQTNGSATLSWAAGTSGSLDDGYNASPAITADAGPVAITNNAADNNGVMTLEKTPVGAQSGNILTVTAGANLTGHGVQITNAGTGKDINGTSNTWSVSKVGLGTFVGITTTGTITATGAKVAGASPLVFEGATADGTNVNTFAITDPTAARTTTFPDATGEVKLRATATHNYGGAHADWTLSVNEQAASFITATNADAGANVLLGAALPGACYFINNASGQILTFKVTGQTGGTIANSKRAFYCSDAVDVYEIWEQS